jgi:hypothetical protein
MDNTALALIVSMNILLIIVLGTFGFFIYKLIKNQQKPQSPLEPPPPTGFPVSPDYHPEIVERLKSLEKLKSSKRADLFCPNHPDEPGEASCAICDHLFCKSCIKPFKALHLCKEHMPLLMKNDWEEVLTVQTSTEDPEQGVKLYDIKKQIFKEKHIPTYIETHYKINVDQDYVETYLVLFAIKSDVTTLKDDLGQFQSFH